MIEVEVCATVIMKSRSAAAGGRWNSLLSSCVPDGILLSLFFGDEMSTTILRSQQCFSVLKHCCERRIVVLISLLHAQQDALTQYKDYSSALKMEVKYSSESSVDFKRSACLMELREYSAIFVLRFDLFSVLVYSVLTLLHSWRALIIY
jgi:hypothetical protein